MSGRSIFDDLEYGLRIVDERGVRERERWRERERESCEYDTSEAGGPAVIL